jgi:hypothetical protein
MTRAGRNVLAGWCSVLATGALHAQSDTAFRAMQARGTDVMGVDQDQSRHQFDLLPHGGRIVLQALRARQRRATAIREHLRSIGRDFARGDFSSPMLVHAQVVPGTAVMTERSAYIRYGVRDLPRGGELRITTRDTIALRAIGEFIR